MGGEGSDPSNQDRDYSQLGDMSEPGDFSDPSQNRPATPDSKNWLNPVNNYLKNAESRGTVGAGKSLSDTRGGGSARQSGVAKAENSANAMHYAGSAKGKALIKNARESRQRKASSCEKQDEDLDWFLLCRLHKLCPHLS